MDVLIVGLVLDVIVLPIGNLLLIEDHGLEIGESFTSYFFDWFLPELEEELLFKIVAAVEVLQN